MMSEIQSNQIETTLTDKIMTGTNNTLTASLLKSATTEVNVSSATAPTIGQVLTATSSTAATWQAAGGGGGGLSEDFSAYQASGTALTTSDQTMIFGTENFDTGSNFNTTTGIYTIPSTGTYRFDVNVPIGGNLQDSDRLQLIMLRDATQIGESSPEGSGDEAYLSLNVLDSFTIGDEVKITIRNISASRGSTTSAKENTRFFGYKIA